MASLSFGSNIASLIAQRRLGEATQKNTVVSERLSSGLRINKASDDPASLAVLTSLNTNSKIYSQAIRNLNDGISVTSIADSAVSALTDITTRLKELATQASNGTYSTTQRSALDAEAQALSQEYSRITQTTTFNGRKLFDSSAASGLVLQAGLSGTDNINSNLGGVLGTGTFTAGVTVNVTTGLEDISLGDVDNDGDLDMLLVSSNQTAIALNDGNGGFGTPTNYSFSSGNGEKGSLADINNDGNLDIVAVGGSGGTATASIRLGTGSGSFGSVISYQLCNSINWRNNS